MPARSRFQTSPPPSAPGPSDESGQALAFSVTQTSADATLTFSVAPSIAPNGTLTYTATPDTYGSATFDVVLTDNGAGAPPNANTLRHPQLHHHRERDQRPAGRRR